MDFLPAHFTRSAQELMESIAAGYMNPGTVQPWTAIKWTTSSHLGWTQAAGHSMQIPGRLDERNPLMFVSTPTGLTTPDRQPGGGTPPPKQPGPVTGQQAFYVHRWIHEAGRRDTEIRRKFSASVFGFLPIRYPLFRRIHVNTLLSIQAGIPGQLRSGITGLVPAKEAEALESRKFRPVPFSRTSMPHRRFPEMRYADNREIDTLAKDVKSAVQQVKAMAEAGHVPVQPEGRVPAIAEHEIQQISDRVIRVIDTRFTIERERRGYYR